MKKANLISFLLLVLCGFGHAVSASYDNGGSLDYVPNSQSLGIHTTVVPEALTLNGNFALEEGSAPSSSTTGYGKIYVNSTDSNLYFLSASGTTTMLSNGSSGGASSINELSDGKNDASSVFLGTYSGTNDDGSNNNTGLGIYSLQNMTSGTNNVAIGYESLRYNQTGTYNTALGYRSGQGTSTYTGSDFNVFIGHQSGKNISSTSDNNSALGSNSLEYLTTGDRNVALGDTTLFYNQTGSDNIAAGYQAGRGTATYTASDRNILIGRQSGYAISDNSDGNTALGYLSLYQITNGDYNIALGYQAGDNIQQGSQNIILGYDIDAPDSNGDSQLVIANLIYSDAIDGTGTTKSTGNIGIGDSSPEARLKVNGDIMVGDTLVYDEVYSNSNGATLNINWNNGNRQTVMLSETVTNMNFTDPPGPASLTLQVKQNGTGSIAINSSAWSGESTYWPSGVAPTLTTTANAIDLITCFYDGSIYHCQIALDFQEI